MSSRFDRDLNDLPDEGVAVSRFDRLDPDHTLNPHLLEGATLNVCKALHRIEILFSGERELRGTFPSFSSAIQGLSDALKNDTPLESVAGEVANPEPLDQLLLDGALLAVQPLGEQIHVQILVPLPERKFEYRGETHYVARTGLRYAKGLDLLQTVEAALRATEEVSEHSLFKPSSAVP